MRLLSVWLGLMLVTSQVDAHKLQFSMTQMDWRVNGSRLEVVHSVHLDDAMVVLAELGDPRGVLDARAKAKLMLYVDTHFGVESAQQPLPLEPVGAEIRGDFLWIYQEIELPAYPAQLSVFCELFHDWFPAQRNQVNYAVGDVVKTRYFDRDNKRFSFD